MNKQHIAEWIRIGKKVAMLIILYPWRIFPVHKNRVILHEDLGCRYAGNPKYITEYLLRYYPKQFDIIYTFRNVQDKIKLQKKGIKAVKFNSISYFYYMMTSAVFVTNSGGYSYIPLRKTQFVLNTHHGGGAYKMMGRHMFSDSKLFRADLRLSNKNGVVLSTCTRATEAFMDSCLTPKERIWEIGMPRNDMLIHYNKKKRDYLRSKLGFKNNEKLVLFAPTYRKIDDNYFNSSVAVPYGIDCERVCAALKVRFGGDWKFGFRMHPCATNRNEILKGNIIDFSDYDDMQELLLVADVMINDFSSSMWDFMLTGRPSFMFALDLEHYVKTTRVYTPVEEWPFPKAISNDELEYNILNFDEERYKVDCKKHYESLGGCETGKATELVCERIYNHCFQKAK